jgi:nucleotide-binding universal stress UspA family protein
MLHVIESIAVSQSELVEWKFDDQEKLDQMVPIDSARKPEIAVEVGSPAEEILRLASTKNAELIVMGSRHGGVVSVHVRGKTLHHVVQRASCPVLTVCAH